MKGPTGGPPRPREPAAGAMPVRGTPCTHPGAAGDEPCRVPAVNGSKRAADTAAVKQGGTAERLSVPIGGGVFHFQGKGAYRHGR